MRSLLVILLLAWSSAYGADDVSADSATSDKRSGVVHWVIDRLKHSNEVRPRGKTFSCAPFAAPFYDNTSGVQIVAGAQAVYSLDKSDPELHNSQLTALGRVGFNGMVGFEVTGSNYTRADFCRVNYRVKVSTTPMKFWGIGYANGANDDNKGEYDRIMVQARPDALFHLGSSLYAGGHANVNYTRAKDFTNQYLIGDESAEVFAVGFGPSLQWDSRDVPENAYRGQYLRIDETIFGAVMNARTFSQTSVTFATYHPMWRNATLAFEYHSMFSFGDVPWTMLALVAENSCRMRGYYEGRYRDRNIIEGQIEVRQRLPKRFGVVAWAGMANVFPSFGDLQLSQTLPNYGVGARWEFKHRLNLRLDLGFGKNKPGVIFNLNEAF